MSTFAPLSGAYRTSRVHRLVRRSVPQCIDAGLARLVSVAKGKIVLRNLGFQRIFCLDFACFSYVRRDTFMR